MAIKPATGLETHPVGTVGLNGIINGNWEKLEAIFAPLAVTGTTKNVAFNPATKLFEPTSGTTSTFEELTYTASQDVEIDGANLQYVAITGNWTPTIVNLAANKRIQLAVFNNSAGSKTHGLLTEANWIGADPPTSIAANKLMFFEFISLGTTDAHILGIYHGTSVGTLTAL